MSSLTTTTINTANGTTNLTLSTGNTSGPAIVVTSGTNLAMRGNSTANIITVNTSSVIVNAASTFNSNTTFSANISVTGSVSATTNVSTNTITANTVSAVNASITSNTLNFGASSITATQYANGYTRLPNGLLYQWGSVGANTTVGSINFPAAFSPVFSLTAVANDKSTTCMVAVTSLTNTTATVLLASNTGTRTVYWQAIGL